MSELNRPACPHPMKCLQNHLAGCIHDRACGLGKTLEHAMKHSLQLPHDASEEDRRNDMARGLHAAIERGDVDLITTLIGRMIVHFDIHYERLTDAVGAALPVEDQQWV